MVAKKLSSEYKSTHLIALPAQTGTKPHSAQTESAITSALMTHLQALLISSKDTQDFP